MPGKTPNAAVDAYLAPLRSALSCVVRAKIVPTSGGRGEPGRLHAWSLNGGAGAALNSRVVLQAGMRYQIIEDEGERGPWRVTTKGYMYALEGSDGRELFAAHWHPATVGEHVEPHIHLPDDAFNEQGAWLARAPIHTGRFTLEGVIRLAIMNLKVEPLCSDWDNRLLLAETPHRLYRTWHQTPGEREPIP